MKFLKRSLDALRSDHTRYQSDSELWGSLGSFGAGDVTRRVITFLGELSAKDDTSLASFFVTYSECGGPVQNTVLRLPYHESENKSDVELLLTYVTLMMEIRRGAFVLHNWWRVPESDSALNTMSLLNSVVKAGREFRRLRSA